MEEILASIRRIIEDNDTGKTPPGEDESMQRDHDVPQEAAPAPRQGTVIEVDAFRAEFRGSLADAAETKPAGGEAFPMRSQIPDAPPRKQMTLAEVQAQIASEQSLTPAQRPSFAEPHEDSSAEQPRAAPQAAAEPSPEQVSLPKEAGFGRTPAATASRPAASEAVQARPAIISERAERQVAAAFGELSEAFAARANKTFDDMAEEMMRPMLRDWLDNNLPVLVERLVREEIERVARGGQ